ncbi:MAG: P1 family peptidase [Firmicutes bacterium]|jgi:L-aminopeptidase/D-esterase-like protein|uniref:Peptidase S58 family protein n=1 Tax=Sulfobacillus benefaciens TaxID=453960 RepID=A0A2T2X6B9_9FIRM|nr:P1 family peptidase [Bacillota bacterium]MCL5015621.1 P1 family peptidase [Bacillota bacterium]PSR30050.1 MAG: peptidase S58 family protein [Sulfobacillus benefaciens]
MPNTPGYDILPGIIKIPGVGLGTVSDAVKGTGITALLLPPGSRAAVDVAGGAPATRETPVLDPANLVPGPDAIILSGGSALGLQTADGAQDVLHRNHRGFAVANVHIPIVVAACIFDLDYGQPQPPTLQDGQQAMEQALMEQTECLVPEGSAGAGTGATVGKSLGPQFAMKGGQAAISLITPGGLMVAALIVVNAMGSILAEDGRILAGPRSSDGHPQATTPALWEQNPGVLTEGESTTIGAIITNGRLSKAELVRVCRMGHDGLARAIDPVHTPWDGDTLFAVSAGDCQSSPAMVGALAAHAVSLAIRRAVSLANAETGSQETT